MFILDVGFDRIRERVCCSLIRGLRPSISDIVGDP